MLSGVSSADQGQRTNSINIHRDFFLVMSLT